MCVLWNKNSIVWITVKSSHACSNISFHVKLDLSPTSNIFHLQYDCKGIGLNERIGGTGGNTNETEPIAWWTDPDGNIHFYWYSDGSDHDSTQFEAAGCSCLDVSNSKKICCLDHHHWILSPIWVVFVANARPQFCAILYVSVRMLVM